MLKILGGIWNAIKTIVTAILIALLAIILTQRFSNNNMSVAGVRIFTVVSPSMIPKYVIGDTLITKSLSPEKLKVGDDITYIGTEATFKDRIVTHRIVSIEKNKDGTYTFQTKGIANDAVDPKINETQIYGKVVYKIKTISYINSITGNLYGLYFMVFIPMGIAMFIDIISFGKNKEEKEKNKENDDDDDEEDTYKEHEERMKKRRQRRRQRRRNRRKDD